MTSAINNVSLCVCGGRRERIGEGEGEGEREEERERRSGEFEERPNKRSKRPCRLVR